MTRKITRRDFLIGTQVAIGTSLFGACSNRAVAARLALGADDYPPALTGLRGSHDGSWETMHRRVAGTSWPSSAPDEHYDLVVVGSGISGP